MKNKYLTEELYSEELDNNFIKQSPFLNQNNELFDEDSNVVHTLISVKRVSLPQNGEKWEIIENNRVVLTLNGLKLTKKEKSFLYTPVGINFLLNEFKNGNRSVTEIRQKLKQYAS